jgi:hypothetical protein
MRGVSRAGFLRTFHETSLHCVYSLVYVFAIRRVLRTEGVGGVQIRNLNS